MMLGSTTINDTKLDSLLILTFCLIFPLCLFKDIHSYKKYMVGLFVLYVLLLILLIITSFSITFTLPETKEPFKSIVLKSSIYCLSFEY